MKIFRFIGCFLIIFSACKTHTDTSYNSLRSLLVNKIDIIELSSNDDQSRILISPYHQGKVLASTYNGAEGVYNGWINPLGLQDLDKNKKLIGGEERLWLSPLGGQFSFYYQQIKPIHDDNWLVPDVMSAEAYTVDKINKQDVQLSKEMQLTNFIGASFNFRIDRKIALLNKTSIQKNLNIEIDNKTQFVAFETYNTLTNLDTIAWQKETGLVGLWSAGMYNGADDSVVIVPIQNNVSKNDILQYFGEMQTDRFQIKNGAILFKGDGSYKCKIGIPNTYASPIYGCYTKSRNRLTIIQYRKTNDSKFSNSFVAVLDNPYVGETIPIYNNDQDFFELESNAPLKELNPMEKTAHWHRVYHFSSDVQTLNAMAKKLLGVDLEHCYF